jgi:PKD repeat protein
VASDGSYTVTGGHMYGEEGAALVVRIDVSASGGLSATSTGSATIADATLTASSPTAATIGSSGTSFTATGAHKYTKHGTYTVTVTIRDAGMSSVTKTLTITA